MPAISLYRLIDDKILEEAGLKINQPEIYYELEDATIEIPINEQTSIVNINELDGTWTPELHNLMISQNIEFNNFSVFFGEKSITMPNNDIGIAVHIYSRESNFQTTTSLEFHQFDQNNVSYYLNHIFEKDSIKGKINFDFFLYLKSSKTSNFFQADIVGSKLAEDSVLTYTIAIDGTGSMFPILETNEPGAPLWSLDTNWNDPLADPFNTSYVSLRLNQAHPRYNSLVGAKGKVDAYLMNEILANSMSIITQSVLYGEEPLTLEEIRDESEDDSIGKVVYYWIESFNLNTRSPAEISNSFHKYLESMNLS
ncbi:hypothetical protein [Enterococcus sp. N342-3-1-2]